MCGIAVIASRGVLSREEGLAAMQAMLAAAGHRGPDEAAHLELALPEGSPVATLWLGATRLNLRGGDAGAQPALAKTVALAYNGETYSTAQPQPPSDTAALADALATHGGDALASLQGMYAIAAWLGHTGELILHRDAFGIKPLYYSQPQVGLLVVASEPASIYASGLVRPHAPGAQVLAANLRLRVPGAGGCLDDQIIALPPGIVGRWNPHKGGLTFGALAQPPKASAVLKRYTRKAYSQHQAKSQALLAESTRHAAESSQGIGLMLSGGADAAMLAYILAHADGPKPVCFTTQGPEESTACAIADKLGLPWQRIEIPSDVESYLTYLKASASPIADTAGYTTWLVARAARRQGIAALISGAGADERFAGYRRHIAFARYLAYSRGYAQLLRPVGALFRAVPNTIGIPASIRHTLGGLGADPAATYQAWMQTPGSLASYLLATGALRAKRYRALLNALRGPISQLLPLQAIPTTAPYQADYADAWLAWALAMDKHIYLGKQVLTVTDEASMAASVEVRVPYLSQQLWQHMASITPTRLLAGGRKGYLYDMLAHTPIKHLAGQGGKLGFGLHAGQGPRPQDVEHALGLDRRDHPLYLHLPFEAVQSWLDADPPHTARFALYPLATNIGGRV